MADDLAHWYKTLELEPGASLEEVNQAYKDLALVWHPDRLPQDSLRLQAKAQAKLQEINNARDRLREYQADRSTTSGVKVARTKSTATKPENPRTRTQRESARPSSQRQQTRPTAPDRPPAPTPTRTAETNGYPHPQATRTSNRQTPAQTKSNTPPQRPDLTGVDWSGMDLNERDFSNRNLTNANLSNSDLKDSFLHGTNLAGANLHKANLFRANLFQANLSNANLREANLISADLSGADLSGADLTGARIRVGSRMTVRLIGANLTGTIMPDGNVYAKV
jgi:Pentapeptide repeats (8 copies)/DnaJ domain